MGTAFPEIPPETPDRAAATDSMRPRLQLHIPPHHPAPSEQPDFSYVPRFPAGAVERPDIAVRSEQTHPLAYKLIRVLGRNATAVGDWGPHLPPRTRRPGLGAGVLSPAHCG